MRFRAAVTLCALAAVGFLSTACDTWVGYTVVNNTDQPVTAWILYAECESVTGYRGDYVHERIVGPGETVEVSDITGAVPEQPWCLQVIDQDRKLLLSEPYDETGTRTYTVTRDLRPGATIPRKGDLPKQPWLDDMWEGFREAPLAVGFYLVIVIGFLAGLTYVAFITVRHFYRTYLKKQRV
jgi:hypothetical protein